MKIAKTSLIIVFLFFIFQLRAQKGRDFPFLEGETLNFKPINVPKDTKGKYTLIGIAYSKKSEDALQSWFNPVYQTFIHKPKNPGLFYTAYDVNVFFIPMFTGVKKAAYKTVMNKMKKQTDPKLVPHILFYKGELKKYKEALGFDKKDVPYFFVLDKGGKIIYTTSGTFSDEKMEKVEEIVEEE